MQGDSEDSGDGTAGPVYRDPSVPVDRRLADLLDRMTVAEKAGQLVGTWGGELHYPTDLDDVADLVRDNHLGAVAPFGWGGSIGTEVDEIVDIVNDLQTVAVQESRLGIPLLFNVDAVHGHAYVAGAAVFPNGLGAAATWDTDLIERGADVTATEVAATGAHQNYSPTCDVGREPRWGRVFETFGESPRLVAEMAAAKVRGYQGDGDEDDDSVIATAKHFPAYSEPERGEDAAPVDVSEYKLRNTFVPPFEAAFDAGVESVMPCYNSIDGDPVHGSEFFLTDLLRGDLGFDGHVVSDWGGIRHLHEEHETAVDLREAVYDARTAGLDVASVGSDLEAEALVDLVESGDLSESVVDESVRRVLELKFRLGLFEDPFVEKEHALETVGRDDHQAAALDTAREAMTLLTNDGLLPLDGDEDVFVGGPNADDLLRQVGGWSVESAEHVDGTTIREALESRVDGDVTHEQGATLNEELDVDAAAEKATAADVAVLALGEGWYLHEFGAGAPRTETGAFPTRERLALAAAQQALVEAVAETGTPVVGVLVTGRPLAVEHLAARADAVLMAYFPGSQGGIAVAETLLGENDPSGRLPITVPRSAAQAAVHHDYLNQPRPIGDHEHPDSYDPLYEFGHGLSYTEFDVGAPAVGVTDVGPGDTIHVDVTVANVGDRAGSEVVQVYASTESTALVRPERELVGFERVDLDAGEERTVTVEVPVEHLGYYAPRDGHRVEAGDYDLIVDDGAVTVTVDGEYL